MGAETSGADLLPADAHARAMESLKKIYTLVSKDGDGMGDGKWMENGWKMLIHDGHGFQAKNIG
jgi:hypothetical protein